MNTQLFGSGYRKISMAPHLDIDKIARNARLACAFLDFDADHAAGRPSLRKLLTKIMGCSKAGMLLAQRAVPRRRI